MSVDVEEHFQVSAFEDSISRDAWGDAPSRVQRNVERVLERFAENDARATFFFLGWVAERLPGLVTAVVEAGHEVASHGYDHRRVTSLSPEQFREDIVRTRAMLQDLSGCEVIGYRAPSFSIGEDTPWAHDILLEAGYRYSSSIYPIRHDHYGMPDAPRFPYRVGDGLLEIPLTTVPLMGRNLPGAGGGYFRLLPVAASRWLIERVNRRDQASAVFYFHPWEVDPEQPRVDGISAKARFRHYINLHRFESRLSDILRRYRWDRMDQVYGHLLNAG